MIVACPVPPPKWDLCVRAVSASNVTINQKLQVPLSALLFLMEFMPGLAVIGGSFFVLLYLIQAMCFVKYE